MPKEFFLFPAQTSKASLSPGGSSHDGCISGWEPSWRNPPATWDQIYQVLEDEEHWNNQLERWYQGEGQLSCRLFFPSSGH